MRFRNSDRRPRWRALLIVLATAVIVAPAAAFASNSFTDVTDSDFYHDAVDWMADNGVTVGCNPPDNTRYCPDEPVTRGEMAVFLERLDTKDVFVRPGDDAVDGGNADTVDGMHASDFLGATDQAVDSDKLDGKDATAFLGAAAQATDSDKLDGLDSSAFETKPSSRTISVSPGELIFDPTDPDFSPTPYALYWGPTYSIAAGLTLAPPADWDGGEVAIDLLLAATTDAAGDIAFFSRAQSLSIGDTVTDPSGEFAAAVSNPGDDVLFSQRITVPASDLTGTDVWRFRFQRDTTGDDTYPDSVAVHMLNITYQTS